MAMPNKSLQMGGSTDDPPHRPSSGSNFLEDDLRQIVPGCEQHQGQYQSKPDTTTPFLSTIAKRSPAHRFNRIEEQVSPVQHRNREQVDHAEIDRQHRQEPKELIES